MRCAHTPRVRRSAPTLDGSERPRLHSIHTVVFVTLLVISVIVGSVYLSLGLKARAHLIGEAGESDRSIGWIFWWSLEKRLYDPEGQQLCRKGNRWALVLVALYVAWYVLLLRK